MELKQFAEIPGQCGWGPQWNAYRRRLQLGEVLQEISSTYGDVARIPIAGSRKVLISHPDDIRDVLVSKSQYFGLCGQDLLRRVLPWGLIATEGQFHDEHRAVMLMTLRKVLTRRVLSAVMARSQHALSPLQDGAVLDLTQFCRSLSLSIAATLLFPVEAGEEITSRVDHAALLDLLSQTNSWFLGMPIAFQKLCFLVGFRRTAAMLMTRRRVRDQLTEAIALASAIPRSGPDADVMSLVMNGGEVGGQMTGQFLQDNLLTILIAGYETTANTIAWAMWEAAQQKPLQSRMAEEGSRLSDDPAANMEWSNNATWTSATVQESLRMYPSVWALPRRTLSEYRMGEYLLPKDTWVYVSQWVTHRDPRWFPNPLQFTPDRWLTPPPPSTGPLSSSAVDPATSPERPQFSFFPFGGGKRFCIGKAIFDEEACILLGNFFARWELTPLPDCRPRPAFYVTMQPNQPLLVKLKRRA
jgi:cytochrome P450